MKIIKSLILAVGLLAANSCSLNLLEDPNSVQPDEMLPTLVINSMQRNTAGLFNTMSTFGMQLTRQQNAGASIYESLYNPQSFDGSWSQAYANILLDGDRLIEDADKNGLARHAGIARVLSAYVLTMLVDYFGDVPYSEAFQGSSNFNPAADNMED
ncbi:MAG TPA: SusD/RagB family nutrient-binding outer membrane lipoprotein, partial [Chryseosolibacter sp.]|nr:SusD/RagB family nutrient-binding outer membrane lipoprotein [Chryseosolibacter sp.]